MSNDPWKVLSVLTKNNLVLESLDKNVSNVHSKLNISFSLIGGRKKL